MNTTDRCFDSILRYADECKPHKYNGCGESDVDHTFIFSTYHKMGGGENEKNT
jgi:hypothetical protein